MKAVLDKNEQGKLIRKAGVMAIVIKNGTIKAGDKIRVEVSQNPYIQLDKV